MLKMFLAAAVVVLAGCASTSVTPVAKNKIIIDTSAAPVCGSTGAQKIAVSMAAVETLRRGYQRFYIAGSDQANNVGVYRTGPTNAMTTSTYRGYGNTVYGNSYTTYGGGTTMVYGTHDASLAVLMINPGEPGFANAVDAKEVLGEDWQKLVEKGVSSCG